MRVPRELPLFLTALCGLAVPNCAEDTTVLPADAEADLICDEVVTWPVLDGDDEVSYRRYRWDSTRRIRTQESRADQAFDGHVRLAWRYDDDGKELAYAGFARDSSESSYDNFQHDREYDEQGNLSDFRLSYPSQPDVNVPSDASVWMGTRYEHEYDAQGLLQSSVVTPYGPGHSRARIQQVKYEHDAAQRCATQLTSADGVEPMTERFSYDDADRLVEEQKTGGPTGPRGCTESTTSISYDEQNRITAHRTWVCDRSRSERADIETSYSYDADGARRAETIDLLNDLVNDTITTEDGQELLVTHSINNQSSGCAAITAAIGGRSDQRCRVR